MNVKYIYPKPFGYNREAFLAATGLDPDEVIDDQRRILITKDGEQMGDALIVTREGFDLSPKDIISIASA